MKIYILIAKGETRTENLYVGTNKESAINRNLSGVDFGEDYLLMLQIWKDGNIVEEIEL